jgi:succinoglycan biosynthesis transport protein ExoP
MTNYPLAYGHPIETTLLPSASSIPEHFVHPGLTLEQIGAIVWAYRRWSILIVLLVLALTAALLAVWPRTYSSTATLMVNYEVNDPRNGKELPVGQVYSYIATQVELMQTSAVLLAVVDRLKLTQYADYARGYREEAGTLRDWVAGKLVKKLVISPSQIGSQLIYVTYSANDAKLAAQVPNTIAEVYKEQERERAAGPPGERARRYTLQLQDLKEKVDLAQRKVTAFHDRSGVIEDGNQTNVDMNMLGSLESRLLEAQNARRVAEARTLEDPAVSDQALASTGIQAVKSQLAAQELRLAQLNRTYTPNHPDIQEAKLQVENSQRALATSSAAYGANATSALKMAQRLESKLQRAVADQRANVLTLGRLRDESAKYQLEFQSAQEVYKRALDGYDQIMFAAADGPYTNVDVVSRATPPMIASAPKLLTGSLLGCIAAAILGLGLPLVYELFNRKVRCRDDLERHHGVPVLVEFGRVPRRVAR